LLDADVNVPDSLGTTFDTLALSMKEKFLKQCAFKTIESRNKFIAFQPPPEFGF